MNTIEVNRMSDITEFEKFYKCVDITKHDDGRTEVNCKLGLWGTDAPTMREAIVEAKHYFQQYLADGEYSEIIGGKSVIDKLTEHNRG
tara:strand:- start:55 stop:318 length:264 start_codon:yes stop_codon:yes gene_type:complete